MGSTPGIIIIFEVKLGREVGHTVPAHQPTLSQRLPCWHICRHILIEVLSYAKNKRNTKDQQEEVGEGGENRASLNHDWEVGHSMQLRHPLYQWKHSAQSQTEAAENSPNQSLKLVPLLQVYSRLVLKSRQRLQTAWLTQNQNKILFCQPYHGTSFVHLWLTGQKLGQVQWQTPEIRYHPVLSATSLQVGFLASKIQSKYYT